MDQARILYQPLGVAYKSNGVEHQVRADAEGQVGLHHAIIEIASDAEFEYYPKRYVKILLNILACKVESVTQGSQVFNEVSESLLV